MGEELRPLLGVEISRTRRQAEAERRRKPLQLQRGEARSQSTRNRLLRREGLLQKEPVRLVETKWHARAGTALEPQDGRVDARRRREGRAVESAYDRDVVPGSPVGGPLCRRPDGGLLRRELPLHDHIRASQRQAGITEKTRQNRARSGERQVRDDGRTPRSATGSPARPRGRPPPPGGRRSASAEPWPARVALDDADACARQGELGRDQAGTTADLDHEVARPDSRVGYKVGRKPLTAKEVLTGRPVCGAPRNGHGAPS